MVINIIGPADDAGSVFGIRDGAGGDQGNAGPGLEQIAWLFQPGTVQYNTVRYRVILGSIRVNISHVRRYSS